MIWDESWVVIGKMRWIKDIMISQLIFKHCNGRIYCAIRTRMYLLSPVHNSLWNQFSKPYIDKKKTFLWSQCRPIEVNASCRSPRTWFIPLERSNDHALNFWGIIFWNYIQNYNLLNRSLHSNEMDVIALTPAAVQIILNILLYGFRYALFTFHRMGIVHLKSSVFTWCVCNYYYIVL